MIRQQPVPRQYSSHINQVQNPSILTPHDLNSEPLNAPQKTGKSEPQDFTPEKKVFESTLDIFTAKDDHDIISAARSNTKMSMSLICK